MGKGENVGNQHFLLFPQFFLPFPKQIAIFQLNLICGLQMLLILDLSKNLSFGKELSDGLLMFHRDVINLLLPQHGSDVNSSLSLNQIFWRILTFTKMSTSLEIFMVKGRQLLPDW